MIICKNLIFFYLKICNYKNNYMNMNVEISNKFNQQRFLFQQIINKIKKMQETIDELQKKINPNKEHATNDESGISSNTVVSILANYDSRLEELEKKIDLLDL